MDNIPENNNQQNNKTTKVISIIILVIVIFVATIFISKNVLQNNNDNNKTSVENKPITYSEYRMKGNDLQKFDLSFLKLENTKENKIYSPLSIKYALAMLNEGANGETKKQIEAVIGDYASNKYVNSANMSFANALFVKDTYKDFIKPDYITNLKEKYNADVVYDSFQNATKLNQWVSDKTLKLINNIINDGDLNDLDYTLINALAIDMEWINKIQPYNDDWGVSYAHEKQTAMGITMLQEAGYTDLTFEGKSDKAKSVEVGASINKYDIVNTIGEENIRKVVGAEYQKWLDKGECVMPDDPDVNTYLNNYIQEINSNYKQISSSTDFYVYDDRDIKGFAKDLKTYNNTTLQYIGIMPKDGDLVNFINNMTEDSINKYINNFKSMDLSSFDEGYITQIYGLIPLFNYDYELKLIEDLNKLGITDVFDSNKADLSNLSSQASYIDKAFHKSNIDFSNDGIKAAAITVFGGRGATGCGFDYLYDVPIKKIDLTFDKPYLYIIRDKKSGEVWFIGTVYNPSDYVNTDNEMEW